MANKESQKNESEYASKYISNIEIAEQIKQSPRGVTSEYVRKNYDSQSARKKFHDSQFEGKKTIIGADGTKLHRSHEATKKKYGEKRASYHEAQADHIDPVKNIHERHKKNPWLTDEDIQEVANRKSNFQELDRHENASKGEMSEFQRGIEKRDIKRAAKGLKAQAETDILLAGKTATAVATDFVDGASASLHASAVPLAIFATQNLVAVANNEKTLPEAAKDVGAMAGKIAVTGGATELAFRAFVTPAPDDVVAHMTKVGNIAQIGNVIVVAELVTKTTVRYLNGEITGDEFFYDIGNDAVGMVGGILAHKLFVMCALPGPMLASMIGSAVCSEIYAQANKLWQEKKDNKEIREIAEAASAELKVQQEELHQLMEENHAQWAKEMDECFRGIAAGLAEQNVAVTNQNLRKLAKCCSFYESGDDVLNDLRPGVNNGKTIHLLRGE